MRKVILSLFDLTGNWSRPWKEKGYQVIQIDIQKRNRYTYMGLYSDKQK